MTLQPICLTCKHLTPYIDKEGYFYCAAFPNTEVRTPEEIQTRINEGITIDPKGIPDEVLFGENPHTSPIEGQVGDFIYSEGTPQEQLKKRSNIMSTN